MTYRTANCMLHVDSIFQKNRANTFLTHFSTLQRPCTRFFSLRSLNSSNEKFTLIKEQLTSKGICSDDLNCFSSLDIPTIRIQATI